MTVIVGTAGWQIPRTSAEAFPVDGTTLQRYAARFGAVEINSSFHRPHQPKTYARWAQTTPPGFRFALKLPKTVTHERRLVDCAELVEAFLFQISQLGEKLGPLVIQLPPSLAFDAGVAGAFLAMLRARFDGDLACEPRHASWFEAEAAAVLSDQRVARVAADPALVPAAAEPGGWTGLSYWRLHGSPQMYWSAYGPERIGELAARLAAAPQPAWVFFDNTTSGAAAADALLLQERLA
ncbi:MAG: hypothetical protein B7Y99_11080 [Caulobacterales bacterium 32-69-10]|nr:MAG: hypothetical protein B7Y99_11080 [Caulobacterales bacterium 32-69-10]